MAYDDRLSIRHEFEHKGRLLANKLKFVEYDSFVQVFLNAGERFVSIRLNEDDCRKILNFMKHIKIGDKDADERTGCEAARGSD